MARSPFRPLDEGGRRFIAYDHGSQDAIVVEQRRTAQSGRFNRRIVGPRCVDPCRRSPSHCRYQSEHVVLTTYKYLPDAAFGGVPD